MFSHGARGQEIKSALWLPRETPPKITQEYVVVCLPSVVVCLPSVRNLERYMVPEWHQKEGLLSYFMPRKPWEGYQNLDTTWGHLIINCLKYLNIWLNLKHPWVVSAHKKNSISVSLWTGPGWGEGRYFQ